MEKKPRFCTFCRTPIASGFACDECKKANRRESQIAAQRAYYARRKESRAKLIKENEELKQKLQEVQNAD